MNIKMASKAFRVKPQKKVNADWSSDEYQVSEGDWQSDQWTDEDSSMAGEASVMSYGNEEQDEEEKRGRSNQNSKNTEKQSNLNLDDVGSEDDGDSRQLEDTERSKTNATDVSDMSDNEEQIVEAQHKLMDDKRSLRGMMGLVDEVTMKGRAMHKAEPKGANPARSFVTGERLVMKALETSLVVEREAFKNDVLANDQLSMFDDDEMSFRSYVEEDHIPQRELSKIGQIEYAQSEEQNAPKLLGQIEYLEDKSDSGSLISEQAISVSIRDEDTKEKESATEEVETKSYTESPKSTKSNESIISKTSNQLEEIETEPNNDKDAESEQEESVSRDYAEPECCKMGGKHLCCFVNIGAGGDYERENELVNRLKKLKDDIANMRKELSLARQECKKESEEVAKLIEEVTVRNQTEQEVALAPAYTANYNLEDIIPATLLAQAAILPRSQVAVPTSLLEGRLRATRQTASSTYRKSLNELERMVEKEMASIQDSMIKLEPLNKMAAEWDSLPARDPKRTTYKSDYRLEMVTSEMHLKADVKNAIQEN